MFNFKVFLAELIGTFALVFVGSASAVYGATLLGVALAHGIAVLVFVYAFGHISGTHVNPAVTFGLALNGTVKWSEAVVYWAAQFLGAIIAAFLLHQLIVLVSADAFSKAATSGLLTAQYPFYAMGVEALLAFFLVNTVLHTAVAGKGGALAGVAIGLTLTLNILAGGPLTGASFNPARTFGPALFTGDFTNPMTYLIYFFGPIAGSVVAVGVFRYLNGQESSETLPTKAAPRRK